MFHIILMILKIIGILLLAVLALALFVSLAVLFVPVRYRINGKKDSDGLLVTAEVSWFLRLLRGKAVYPKPGRIRVKLLCFTLYDSAKEPKEGQEGPGKKKKKKEKKEKEKKRVGRDKAVSEKEKNEALQAEPAGEVSREQGQPPSGEKPEEGKTGEKACAGAEADGQETVQDGPGQEAGQKEAGKPWKIGRLAARIRGFLVGIAEKIRNILKKISDALKNIWYTIGRLCDKIKKIFENIGYYMEVFGEEETKAAFSLCSFRLAKIWKNIRPKTCRVKLLAGTGEPDTTGYILALGGILYPWIGNDIVIEPDFENRVLEGVFFVKGRIVVFVLLYAAIKIYFDKNIRYFLKRIKREE